MRALLPELAAMDDAGVELARPDLVAVVEEGVLAPTDVETEVNWILVGERKGSGGRSTKTKVPERVRVM